MNSGAIHILRQQFADYAGRFARDGSWPPALLQKIAHSRNVAADSREIAAELGWRKRDAAVAEALGILHDLGRFEQYAARQTFVDTLGADHGELGARRLLDLAWLAPWPEPCRQAVLCGVRHHNRRELPACLPAADLEFVRLLREADKLDILKVAGQCLRKSDFSQLPELVAGVDPTGPPSPALVAEIRRYRVASYSNIHSLQDIKLAAFAWVHDIHSVPALRRLLDRGLLEPFEESLPACADLGHIVAEAKNHAERRVRRRPRHPAAHFGTGSSTARDGRKIWS